jgi:3-hexulose-6-phosphate synthase
MKLQISFDLIDLGKAVEIASQISHEADILELGTLLLYSCGIQAVKEFRSRFPDKNIMADAKILDRGKDAVTLFAQAGADWVTVMAGSTKSAIHTACTAAHAAGIKVMLDLLDTESLGQSALEAKNLGADALLIHQPHDDTSPFSFLDTWDIIRGNTDLPIFVSARIKRETVADILGLKPDGIIIGKSVTEAQNPAEEVAFFKSLL